MTVGESGQAGAYRLFVSYSHHNEAQRDRLVNALAPLLNTGLIAELWHDRAIDAGDDWLEAIEQAMARADGAIFLLCEGFCASAFCLKQEIPVFLQKQRDEGAVVFFVLGDYCGWDNYDFIKRFQIVPRDNKPVTSFRPHSKAYTRVQQEIKQALLNHQARHAARLAALSSRKLTPTQAQLETAGFHNLLNREFGLTQTRLETAPTARLLAKLPGQTAKLFGRDEELKRLDAWHGHKGVLLWVAEGGYGKSALVRWWLERHAFDPATRFLGQSFYSQGSRNQATTARPFLLAALAGWNIAHAENAPDGELGRLLAQAAAQAPSLIVLDGMEPLQQAAPGDARLHGLLRDKGLAALLSGLAEAPGQALCLATSRLPLPDPAITRSPYFQQETLPGLSPADAQALLAQRGIVGAGRARDELATLTVLPPGQSRAWPAPTELDDLAQMAERCGHHPLALVLAAEFCHSFLDDSAAAFLARSWTMDAKTAHAATVMGWLDAELKEERQDLDRDLARVLGLFDRPAPWAALLALKEHEPPIPGLTETLHRADEDGLLEALARLKQWGLLDADLARPEPDLDAHPLVREHFGVQLEKDNPQAFRAAHRLLFDWFRKLPEQQQPDTLEELEPLYRAMGHGCKAGAWRTALEEVYWDRIHRGNHSYSMVQLGGYSSDLAALAGFFPDGLDAPPVFGEKDEALNEDAHSFLMAEAAFCLMSLSRLEEALKLKRMGIQVVKEANDWNRFCRSALGILDLLVPLGYWAEAGVMANELLVGAAHVVDPEQQRQRFVEIHAYRGRVLHGQGRLTEAGDAFALAELEQRSKLWAIFGFGYTQLLLERACRPEQWQNVLGRGRYALRNAEKARHLLSQALDHCTIGLALSELGESAEASATLDRAVATMQRAGKTEFMPIMHLARARHRRKLDDLTGAWTDHDAALRIAEAGGMRTYLADSALLAGQLHLDQGHIPEAAAQHARAAEIIHADGYGRRLSELHLLDARLRHHQHDPAAARAALQAAEARIRAIGQWGLWRELEQTAAELGTPPVGEPG